MLTLCPDFRGKHLNAYVEICVCIQLKLMAQQYGIGGNF